METSSILKQKANEIVETLGKLFPELLITEIKVTEFKDYVEVSIPNNYLEAKFTFNIFNNFMLRIYEGEGWTDYSAKTCFGAFTKWINAEIDFHNKEIEKLVQLNTNLLGLGEK
jgi:hypothetical protein